MGHTRREHEQGTGLQLMAALAGRDLNVAGQDMDRVPAAPGRRRSRYTERAPARSRGARRVRGADQLELSGRDGITRELLGLRVGSLPGSGSRAPGQPAVVPRVPSAVAVRPADTDAHADLDLPTAPADAVVIGVEVVDEDVTEPRALAADAPAKLDAKEREAPTAEELEALSADLLGI